MAKGNQQTAKNLPAVPYEPTPAEQRALASYEKRKAAESPTPYMVRNLSEAGEAKLNVDHPDAPTGYQMISDAIGSGDIRFTCGLMVDALQGNLQAYGHVLPGSCRSWLGRLPVPWRRWWRSGRRISWALSPRPVHMPGRPAAPGTGIADPDGANRRSGLVR